MAVQFEARPDEAILIVRYESMEMSDVAEVLAQLQTFHQTLERPFVAISNVQKVAITFDVLVNGLDMLRRTLKDMPISLCGVGSGELLELGAKAIGQRQYGGLEVAPIFASEAEAMTWARQKLVA